MSPANPFPDCICEAEAILIIGNMIGAMIILFFLMLMMVYFYKNLEEFLPVLVLFLFSIVIGMVSFGACYLPFCPYIQIFFMLFQTIFFYLKLDQMEFKIW